MKLKKYTIISIITLSILIFGVSYAYYKAKIVGNPTDIGLTAKEVYLKFNGSNTLVSGTIVPGWSETKTFTIENESKREETYNIVIEDLVNTFVTTGYLQYKITSSNGYNMTEYKDISKIDTPSLAILAYNVIIPANTTQNYTIELIYIDTTDDQSKDMGKTLSGKLNIKESTTIPYEENTLAYKVLEDNSVISERSNFSITNVSNRTGTIYKTNKTEDDSTIYYYSGNTTNNWVKFGKYNVDMYYCENEDGDYTYTTSLDSCESDPRETIYSGTDMYWRIIRTNEDASVRLLYAGTSPDTQKAYIMTDYYATHSTTATNKVGYMYGGNTSLETNRNNTNSSRIKNDIDTWYEMSLLTNYDKYISKSAIYCNDRSIDSSTYTWSKTDMFYFGASTRLDTNKTPTYKCGGNTSTGLFESTQATQDKFSVSTTGGGNGQLTYGVALMTADEVSFAGGVSYIYQSNDYSYYYLNSEGKSITGQLDWWTMTPFSAGGSQIMWLVGGIGRYAVDNSGGLIYDVTNYSSTAVRPVLSISNCAKVTGSGTPEDPYVIDEQTSTC